MLEQQADAEAQGALFKEVRHRLSRLGLNQVRDVKKEMIFSRKTLMEFLEERKDFHI